MPDNDLITKCFAIPEAYFEAFKKKMAKLAATATRLGCGQVRWTKMGERMVGREELHHEGQGINHQRLIKMIDVMVDGDAPKLSGWIFIAKLEHLIELGEGKVIIHNPSEEKLPVAYASADYHNCDHCHKSLYRRDTFVLRNEASSEYKQVGRQCLRDFLGHVSPEQLARYFHVLDMAMTDDWSNREREHTGGGGMRWYEYVDLADVLATSIAIIRKFGWCSRRKARDSDNLIATSERVSSKMFDVKPAALYREIEVTEDDTNKAAAMIHWFEDTLTDDKCGDDDYLLNMRTLVGIGAMKHNHVGLAVSMVPFYDRATTPQEEYKASEHVGNIKQRLVLDDIEVTQVSWFEGNFGVTYRINMKQGNNALVWFTSSSDTQRQMKVGTKHTIKGTVKRHEEYKGHKRTILSRCVTIPTQEANSAEQQNA